MAKYYKSLRDHQIRVQLFGVGEVVIPANAKCIELAPGVADVLNRMAYPDAVLEEITPNITADNAPVVTSKKKDAKKPAEEVSEKVEELEETETTESEKIPELEEVTL